MRQFQKGVYEDQVMEGEPTIADKAKMSLAILNKEIMEAEYKSQLILPIVMESDTKVYHEYKWRTYHEKISQL